MAIPAAGELCCRKLWGRWGPGQVVVVIVVLWPPGRCRPLAVVVPWRCHDSAMDLTSAMGTLSRPSWHCCPWARGPLPSAGTWRDMVLIWVMAHPALGAGA